MNNMYDIIIIGAGPAGLTSAIYAKRAGKNVLVLEGVTYGGQIINAQDIRNYPGADHISGFDLATNLYNQVIDLGVEVILEEVTNIANANEYKEITTNKNTYKSKSIIIATGANSRKLGLENENNLIGKGISYCATCDGAFFKDKDVAVVGGGNTALEDVIYLSNICNKVYLIHRRDEFRGDQVSINKVLQLNNVEVLYNSNVTKINGTNYLESIDVNDNNIKVSGLFIAIGKIPNTSIFKDIVELDKNGYILSDELCHTNTDGVFVAGDVRVKTLRQLVTATSDGAVAATEAIKYLNK